MTEKQQQQIDIDWSYAQIDVDHNVASEAPTELDNWNWPFWVEPDKEMDLRLALVFRDRFTPARMKEEARVKREIALLHTKRASMGGDYCSTCNETWPCRTLVLLLQPYEKESIRRNQRTTKT